MKHIFNFFIISILLFLTINSVLGQELGARLNFSDSKYGFGNELFEFSFTLEASSRELIDIPSLVSHSQNLFTSENIQIILDDSRPIAAVMLKCNVQNQNDLESLLKTLYGQWGLNWMNINNNLFTSKEAIHL